MIVEVSLKVVPKHPVEVTLQFDLDEPAALRQLNAWGAQPLPISASVWCDRALLLRLSGSAAAVAAACARLGGTRASEDLSSRLWRSLREQQHAFFDGNAPLWRLSLPPTAPPLELDAPPLIEWGGALRWVRSHQPAAPIRERARQLGGHATLFRGGNRSDGVSRPGARAAGDSPAPARPVRSCRRVSTAADCIRSSIVQIALADFIRNTNAGVEAEAILRRCVHCGFCTATCPTYQLLGDELDGPRGRIYLIKQMLEGATPTRSTQLHLDRCLTCLNCETSCPSGVQYGRLVDIGREVAAERVVRSLPQSVKARVRPGAV